MAERHASRIVYVAGSPDCEIERLLADLGKRMDEYVACMREIPRVGFKLKLDVWRIAARKHDEMDALHARLVEVLAGSEGGLAGVAAWIAAGHVHAQACGLIDEVQRLAHGIRDPGVRAAAEAWLARAWNYAQAGRRAQTAACIYNALAQLAG